MKLTEFGKGMLVAFLLALIALSFAGCASSGVSFDANAMMQQYYAQGRTYKPISLVGVNDLHISGTNMSLVMESTLQPLSIRSQDPGVAGKTIDAVSSVLKLGLGAYFANEGLQALSTTRDPLVVRPEIVTVTPAP